MFFSELFLFFQAIETRIYRKEYIDFNFIWESKSLVNGRSYTENKLSRKIFATKCVEKTRKMEKAV